MRDRDAHVVQCLAQGAVEAATNDHVPRVEHGAWQQAHLTQPDHLLAIQQRGANERDPQAVRLACNIHPALLKQPHHRVLILTSHVVLHW